MLDRRPKPVPRPRPIHPPFPRIVCLLEAGPASDAAITQALVIAGNDAHVRFVSTTDDDIAREAVERAVDAGVPAGWEHGHGPEPVDAIARFTAAHDLIVVSAHPHGRAAGIVLGKSATELVHHAPIPVLVARDPELVTGVLATTRARPADRAALTAATRIAVRLGAPLTVLHVRERDDDERKPELEAELANTRALLGRPLEFFSPRGHTAQTIVDTARGESGGLVVVGSRGRTGVSALASVSERVAHNAPCSVLVMRDG